MLYYFYMKQQFTAIFKKSGRWYLGWIEELRGVNTQGRTIQEVRENLKEALLLVLETNRLVSRREMDKKSIREPIIVSAA